MCRSSHSEEVWRSSFSKNKVVLKKSQHMREWKSLFENKPKLDWYDYVLLKLFSLRGFLTLVSIHMRFPIILYHKLNKCLNSRSRHQSCSIKKAVLKNFPIFTRKPTMESLFNRVVGQKTCNCIKRDSNKGIFLWILRTF